MVDSAPVMAVPLRLGLVTVRRTARTRGEDWIILDGQAVDIKGQPTVALAAALGARGPGTELEGGLAQHRPVRGRGHDGGEPRQRRLRSGALGAIERHAAGGPIGRQPEGRIVPERVRIVVIAPALGSEQVARPDQRDEIMDDILRAPRIRELRGDPLDEAAPLRDLA